MLNIPAHPSFQGVNLLQKSDNKKRSAYLVTHAVVNQYAIIEGKWKLIFDQYSWNYLLYNLHDDPEELEDVKLENKEIFQSLSKKLHFWQNIQVEYYMNPNLYKNFYPFVFEQ